MKLLFIGSFIGCSIAQAEVIIAPNKTSALRSCQEKAAASPRALREEMLSSCQCIVEHTDFDVVEKLNREKKTQALQQLYQQANDACLSK